VGGCDASQLTRDWREFRASLVAQSEVESALEGEEDTEEGELQTRLEVEKRARVQAASAQNLELLKSQLPKLTENPPWAHALPGPEKGCLLIANESLFVGTQVCPRRLSAWMSLVVSRACTHTQVEYGGPLWRRRTSTRR
jgi:hypothetical protein